MSPRTIGIVGLGLIGTSVALAARRAWPDAVIIGVDRSDVIRHPIVAGVLDQASVHPDAAISTDVVVLATPVSATMVLLQQLSSDLRECAVVLDTGSTKRSVMRTAREASIPGFVGGHPMAGGAAAGPESARADLFDAHPWFLVRTGGSPSPLVKAQQFVEGLRAHPIVMTDDGSRHDRLMAAVSHLPQIVATVLMKRVGDTVGKGGLAQAGQGLRDTTRLASSPSSVWESVLATNADELRPLLKELADDLQEIAGQLEDPDAVRRLFDAAKRWRDQI